jgi:hypothetical protein
MNGEHEDNTAAARNDVGNPKAALLSFRSSNPNARPRRTGASHGETPDEIDRNLKDDARHRRRNELETSGEVHGRAIGSSTYNETSRATSLDDMWVSHLLQASSVQVQEKSPANSQQSSVASRERLELLLLSQESDEPPFANGAAGNKSAVCGPLERRPSRGRASMKGGLPSAAVDREEREDIGSRSSSSAFSKTQPVQSQNATGKRQFKANRKPWFRWISAPAVRALELFLQYTVGVWFYPAILYKHSILARMRTGDKALDCSCNRGNSKPENQHPSQKRKGYHLKGKSVSRAKQPIAIGNSEDIRVQSSEIAQVATDEVRTLPPVSDTVTRSMCSTDVEQIKEPELNRTAGCEHPTASNLSANIASANACIWSPVIDRGPPTLETSHWDGKSYADPQLIDLAAGPSQVNTKDTRAKGLPKAEAGGDESPPLAILVSSYHGALPSHEESTRQCSQETHHLGLMTASKNPIGAECAEEQERKLTQLAAEKKNVYHTGGDAGDEKLLYLGCIAANMQTPDEPAGLCHDGNGNEVPPESLGIPIFLPEVAMDGRAGHSQFVSIKHRGLSSPVGNAEGVVARHGEANLGKKQALCDNFQDALKHETVSDKGNAPEHVPIAQADPVEPIPLDSQFIEVEKSLSVDCSDSIQLVSSIRLSEDELAAMDNALVTPPINQARKNAGTPIPRWRSALNTRSSGKVSGFTKEKDSKSSIEVPLSHVLDEMSEEATSRANTVETDPSINPNTADPRLLVSPSSNEDDGSFKENNWFWGTGALSADSASHPRDGGQAVQRDLSSSSGGAKRHKARTLQGAPAVADALRELKTVQKSFARFLSGMRKAPGDETEFESSRSAKETQTMLSEILTHEKGCFAGMKKSSRGKFEVTAWKNITPSLQIRLSFKITPLTADGCRVAVRSLTNEKTMTDPNVFEDFLADVQRRLAVLSSSRVT